MRFLGTLILRVQLECSVTLEDLKLEKAEIVTLLAAARLYIDGDQRSCYRRDEYELDYYDTRISKCDEVAKHYHVEQEVLATADQHAAHDSSTDLF